MIHTRSWPRVADRAAPWVAAALLGGLVLGHRYPAMLDLPCHEEIVAAMRHFGDRSRYPQGLMRWNVGHPNQLFYFLACAFSFVVPVDVACKLVVAGSVAGVPLGAARLADHAGVSRTAALVGAPLALGAFFDFGFVGNLLAFGILLASLPSLDRVARSPSPRAAARATATLVLLYAAHDSALVIGGLSIAILSLGRPLLDRSSVWRAIPVLAGAGLALGEEVIAVHRSGANLSGLPRIIDLGFDQRLRDLPEALLGLHGAQATRPACAAIGGALVVLAIEGLWRGRAALARAVTRDLYDDHRFLALGAALLAGYFVAPFAVTGAMWINARFLGPAVAVVGVALAPTLPRRPSWRVLAFACGAMVLVVALVEPGMESTAKFYEDLDGIVPAIAPGSAIAPLDLAFGGGIPANDLVLIASSAAARAASERGGRMAFSFTQASPIPPVIVAPGHRWDESFLRLAGDMLALEPSRDLRRFRYVLALAPPGQAPRLEAALAPEARLVARSGWWILFESNEDVGSLLAPEEPAHHEETLRDRLARAPGSDR